MANRGDNYIVLPAPDNDQLQLRDCGDIQENLVKIKEMCYRTKPNAKLSEIEKTFNARFIDPEAYQPMEEINAFNFSTTPVMTYVNQGEIQMYNWGLILFWAKNDSIKKTPLTPELKQPPKNRHLETQLKTVASPSLMGIMNGNGWMQKENKSRSTSFCQKIKKFLHLQEFILRGEIQKTMMKQILIQF